MMNPRNNPQVKGSNVASGAAPAFRVRLCKTEADLRAVQRLRYAIFVTEMGGGGPMVDHDAGLEKDRFDAFADHLMLIDDTRAPGDQLIGTYRLMTDAMAGSAGQFYCEAEYDLGRLRDCGQPLLELGRSCLHADYRGGAGMLHLWAGLADFVEAHNIGVMFGVGSFHGTDAQSLAQPLSFLHHRHLAPEHLRTQAKGPTALAMDLMPSDAVDRLAAVRAMPALIKGYMRLGAWVGDGAFVDHAFNTVDISVILSRDAISGLRRGIYAKGTGLG